MKPQLSTALARVGVRLLGTLNYALRESRSGRDWATPKLPLRAIKLWYILPALLHSPDGRIKSS